MEKILDIPVKTWQDLPLKSGNSRFQAMITFFDKFFFPTDNDKLFIFWSELTVILEAKIFLFELCESWQHHKQEFP